MTKEQKQRAKDYQREYHRKYDAAKKIRKKNNNKCIKYYDY